QPLACDAVEKGLGKGSDDGGHVVGLAPVVAVPPDVVAPLDVRLGGAARRLDAVDVIEPVDGRPVFVAAGSPVDALYEAAAVARGDARVSLEQAHDGLFAVHRRRGRRPEDARAEVARDEQLHAAGRAACAETAAGERCGGERDGKGEKPGEASTSVSRASG